jgi:uncharacterized surface protein with fasciclin (FAS1) repeats
MKFLSSNLRAVCALSFLTLAISVPSIGAAEGKKRFKPGPDNIATIAVNASQAAEAEFTTLVAALSCTGLVPAVADPDAELTVFAPTDAAFAAAGLNADNVCVADLEAAVGADLTTILLYHVAGERRPSPSVINGRNKQIMMLNGDYIYPAGTGSLAIGANNSSAMIVAPDILASNGIIHVINAVLLP